jgi:glycosyltransferase involved in cell wall biosynthesis
VTADSHAVASELRAAWGVRVTVVSPGVTALPAQPCAGRYLLYVGAREPRKGVDVLEAAHASARTRGLDAELVLVGDDHRVDDAELAALYAGALAVVQPSFLEGFGLPPLEAAAHGTPAVVSDLPCFAETLGDAALRVPPGDADALSGALLRIAADDDLRARLGQAARDRAAAYTWERAADAMHALLAEAAR